MDTIKLLENFGLGALSFMVGYISLQIAETAVSKPYETMPASLLRCIKMFFATMILVLLGLMALFMDWTIVFSQEAVAVLREHAGFLFLAVPIVFFLIAAILLFYTIVLVVDFVRYYI